VYNWRGDTRYGLPLEIGETVQILEECSGEFRGVNGNWPCRWNCCLTDSVVYYISHGATARSWPVLLTVKALRSRSDIPHSFGLLWTSDQPDAKTCSWQHTTLTIQTFLPPCGIRTHIPSKRAAAILRVRPRGRWDRLSST